MIGSAYLSKFGLFNSKIPAAHVLMPVYEAERFLDHSIKSVMHQSYPNTTLIAYVDGSSDNSLLRLHQYQQQYNDEHFPKIVVYADTINRGVSYARHQLFQYSKRLNQSAYIFQLDADDKFTDPKFIELAMKQILKTKADILLFNFSVSYEDPSQKENAAGLLTEKAQLPLILHAIRKAPHEMVSPKEPPSLLNFTSLGWTKCYAPHVELPIAAACPFEDFVYMAALLTVRSITALPPEYEPVNYLRRSTSICGKRTAKNFIYDIPLQLTLFFETVCSSNPSDLILVETAQNFVVRKLFQYQATLENLVKERTNPEFNEKTLDTYHTNAVKLRNHMNDRMDVLTKNNNIATSGYTSVIRAKL